MLIFNQLRFPFSSLHLLASYILFHVARHTFATLQLEHGTDIYTVKDMLGHTNVRTTQVYGHIVDPSKRKAAEAIYIQGLSEANSIENT